MLGKVKKLAARARASGNKSFHAVIVKRGGAVVASGYNHENIHAEVHALKQLRDTRGVVLYSYRVNKAGHLTMAKPCSRCQDYILDAGVKKVLYSDENGRIVEMRLRRVA